MNAIVAIAHKDLRLMFRDRGDVFFTFVFPVILAIFFGFVFGGNGKSSTIELALTVESDSRLAAGIAADLARDASFDVTRFDTRAQAVDAVRRGKASAAVILPASMQDGLDGIFAGKSIPIDAIVDPARRAEAGLIQGKLNELAFRQFPDMLTDGPQMTKFFAGARASLIQAEQLTPTQRLAISGLLAAGDTFTKSLGKSTATTTQPASTWSPIAVTVAELPARTGLPRSSFDVTFPQGTVWGLAGCIGAFASSIVLERSRGTLNRLRLAPIGRVHLLAGKGLACFTTALLVQALLVGLAVVGFGSSIAQPVMLLVACCAAAFAFSGLAMMLAGFCRTEAEANGAGRGAILILAMIGGGTIPLFFMPPLLKTLSFGSPFRWAIAAMEGPFWRDTPIAEQTTPLLVLLAIGVGGFVVGCRAIGRPFAG